MIIPLSFRFEWNLQLSLSLSLALRTVDQAHNAPKYRRKRVRRAERRDERN